MAEEALRYELQDDVAVLKMDDGKANAISPAVVEQMNALLDRAEDEAKGVLWVGRPGRFSAGFDLAVLRKGPEAVRGLVTAGAELYLRFLDYPKPIVVACTGHALAAGAIALLVADARLGARGDFKIGLNEVSISMTLPAFAVEFARHRLSKRHFVRATIQAELYAPEAAVDAGYLDEVTTPDALFETALGEAARLAALPQPAFAETKRRANDALVALVREALAPDMARLTGG
jgi:enoyl-CoA hydratase